MFVVSDGSIDELKQLAAPVILLSADCRQHWKIEFSLQLPNNTFQSFPLGAFPVANENHTVYIGWSVFGQVFLWANVFQLLVISIIVYDLLSRIFVKGTIHFFIDVHLKYKRILSIIFYQTHKTKIRIHKWSHKEIVKLIIRAGHHQSPAFILINLL